MTEARAQVFDVLAGLLRGHGYAASVDPAYRPPAAPAPVLALVTDAPELVIGMCLGNTAEEPEAHIPTQSARVPKARKTDPGPPLVAYWCDDNNE